MVQMDMLFDGLGEQDPCNEISVEIRRRIEGNNMYDPDYKNLLLYVLANQESAVVPDKKQKQKDGACGVSNKKRKEKDGACQHKDDWCAEEQNDPQYEAVLDCLTEHERSYVLEYEEMGLPFVIKYEEAHSDEECDREPRRKLRSAMKQNVERSKEMPGWGNQGKHNPETKKLTGRIEIAPCTAKKTVEASDYLTSPTACVANEGNACLYRTCDSQPRTRIRSAMKQKVESSNGMPGLVNLSKRELRSTNKTEKVTGKESGNMAMSGADSGKYETTEVVVPDPEYLVFLQTSEVINDSHVCTYGSLRIAYENKEDGKHNQAKENRDDEFVSDVQIIDRASFYNSVNENSTLNISPTISEFRQQLINVLRKPYDKEEHIRLWQYIKQRKPQERHLDLRNGRERSYVKNTDGKSYLDHARDQRGGLKGKLLKCKHDKPKHLNLLRGYFFWLVNCPSDASFVPWLDEECLDIKPGSC